MKRGPKPKPAIERFERKYIPDASSGCWLWTAGCDAYGYGAFSDGMKMMQAHRFAWRHFCGPLPEGKDLHHVCENTRCVNPEHLEPLTRADHVKVSKGHNGLKTHCKHGHEFTVENTGVRGTGQRYCRACQRFRDRRRRARCLS